jgi:Glycosyl hydrolase family 3 C terminal domain.
MAWYPGAEGGNGIADILFGKTNPEGRLPVTFYNRVDELPEFTDYSMAERTYRFMKQEALYPFGYGLSYTEYEYSDMTISENILTKKGLKITVCVSNRGERKGRETVQVYIGKEGEDKINPQLKAVAKVNLEAGEKKIVSLDIPFEAFIVFDENGREYIDNASYRIFVGGSQPDKRSIVLKNQPVLNMSVKSEKKYYIE